MCVDDYSDAGVSGSGGGGEGTNGMDMVITTEVV